MEAESTTQTEIPPPTVEPPVPTPQEIAELIEKAKETLPVPFREDGPPLGFEFDPVPPGRPFIPEGIGKSKKMVIGDYDAEAFHDGTIQEIRKRQQWTPGQKRKTFTVKPPEGGFGEMELPIMMPMDEAERETEKEVKRREKKLHKEQERLHREQQKELERKQREHEKKRKAQMKEEEKKQQQLERDMKKLERDMERERKAEERKKLQEVKKREKDLQKALAAQVKMAQKELQKELAAGPPDDLDLEMETLIRENPLRGSQIERPPFPPQTLELESAFPQLGNKIGGDVVMVWGFVQSFSDIIAIPPFSINDFIKALIQGQKSALLSSIHVVLIRLVQADMEESHHLVLTQGSGGTSNFMDRAVVGIAGTLDEAVSWGFDVDGWRAHLNCYTWPEILRQMAIAAGYGAKRSRGLRDKYQKSTEDTEDAIAEESRAGYALKMPSRLTQGTVKAAAWQVLSEVGPEGITISEIATRIQKQGLRDLRTSKTPEATVAGALSRDAVFCRVAPATYALHAVLPSAEDPSLQSNCMDGMDPSAREQTEGEGSIGNEMETDRFIRGEAWIPLLTNNDYETLSLEQRLEVLKTLCTIALESPTLRACLDARLEREIAEQKRLDIEVKAEKKARHEQAAEETQRKLLELETAGIAEDNEDLDAKVKDLMNESLQEPISGTLSAKTDALSAQNHVRFEPLGKDRRYNRYWSFTDGDGTTEQPSHLFLELNGQFKLLKSRDQLETLIASLESRGAREGPLRMALRQYQQTLNGELPVWKEMETDPDQMEIDEPPLPEGDDVLAKKWAQSDAPHEKKLCGEGDGSWLDRLKVQLSQMEQALHPDTREDFDRSPLKACTPVTNPDFCSFAWITDVDRATSLEAVLLAMGRLEYALLPHGMHDSYSKAPQILYGAWSDTYDPETVSTPDGFLTWVPRSYAAAFLHLATLDAALHYRVGAVAGREALMPYKYVQKPFVRELNPHLDVTSMAPSLDHAAQTVSVQPVRSGGKLAASAFPVLQKGTPIQKRPVAFSFDVEKMREAVQAAERHGTLYANIQLTKGRSSKSSVKQNGTKTIHCVTGKPSASEFEDEDVSMSDNPPSSAEDECADVASETSDDDVRL